MNRKGMRIMFKNEVAEFIYKRTYSRWLDKEGRREDWPETIERFLSFLISVQYQTRSISSPQTVQLLS